MMLDYFTRAVLEAVLAGALSGVVGVLVVLRRRAFFTMSLTHATFPGAVLATILGVSAVAGAAVAALALVGVAALIGRVRVQGSSVASGIMLTAGFALGILAQSVSAVPVDVESFLTGSILTTGTGQLALTAAVLVAAVAVWLMAGRRIVASSFDPAGYRAAGMRPLPIEAVALTLIAACVITLMPVLGAILAVALIVAPAAAARNLVRSTTGMLLLAPCIGVACALAGLWVSRAAGVSAGGAIALAATIVFGLSLPFAGRTAQASGRARQTTPLGDRAAGGPHPRGPGASVAS